MPRDELPVGDVLRMALDHHRAGQLRAARELYEQALRREPDNADALQLLGVIANAEGRHDRAIELIGRAITIKPDNPSWHNNLGTSYRAAGRLDEAAAALKRAAELKPDNAFIRCNYANALAAAGHDAAALAEYREAIRLNATYADAHANLGRLHGKLGQMADAEAELRQALRLNPQMRDVAQLLTRLLESQGRREEAIALQREVSAATSSLSSSSSSSSSSPVASASASAARDPEHDPDVFNARGITLQKLDRLADAEQMFRRAIQLDPRHLTAHSNLAGILVQQGRVDEGVAELRAALAIEPRAVITHSNLLLTLHYRDIVPDTLFAEHLAWARRHAEPFYRSAKPLTNDRDPDRRLRVGYVSADLREHAVSYFATALLAHYDRTQLEVFVYDNNERPDALTERLRALTDGWRSIAALDDAVAADVIRDDRIDILVDLAGHTSGHRLPAFAHRPAPVQVTYLGYPDTTGVATIDYRFTDAIADPPDVTDRFNVERLVRLPETAWCYTPPPDSPDVGPLPAIKNGYVTFASFNNFAKISPRTIELWANVLKASPPTSRLLIKGTTLASEDARQRLLDEFAALGIDPARIEPVAKTPSMREHLDVYNRCDVGLDTYPYTGTTTTCEALWMGVPVVTLCGSELHVTRVSASLLTTAGLSQLIAHAPDDYMSIAAALARDVDRLAQLRQTMRARLHASPLMDGPRFMRHVQQAYRQMWRAWCERG